MGSGGTSAVRLWQRWGRLCPPYGLAFALAALAIAVSAMQVHAQPRPDPGEIHGLKLGLKAAEMSTDDLGDLACGSNGGPPRQMIDGWADFRKCRPELSGLYEVYARFDDEQDYIGRAIDDPLFAQGRLGTQVAGHPVILSVLFDKDGILRGIRMVSDPRGSIMERRMAHMLRLAIINRYEPDGWTCTDFPSGAGRNAGRWRRVHQAALRKNTRNAISWSRRISCASRAKATPMRPPARARSASSKAGRVSS